MCKYYYKKTVILEVFSQVGKSRYISKAKMTEEISFLKNGSHSFERKAKIIHLFNLLITLWILLYRAQFSNTYYPDNNYLLKSNNRNTRKRCEICSNLTINIPERRQWGRSGVFIVKFGHISHLFLILWISKC